MYAKVWNYLRGSVLFQCESPAPERVLNLCGVYGIPFWDVQWETAERFTLRTTRQGAAALEDAAAECGAELRRMEEWGAPTPCGGCGGGTCCGVRWRRCWRCSGTATP